RPRVVCCGVLGCLCRPCGRWRPAAASSLSPLSSSCSAARRALPSFPTRRSSDLVMLVLNLPFKALMFLTLMRPSLVLFLVLWLKLVKDFLKVRCRLALLPFLISCLIWLDLVASLPLIKERILV